MKQGYRPPSLAWKGRTDGNEEELKRWHQVVEPLDLNHIPKVSNGFCIIGFKSDLGILRNRGRVGAARAPDTIRTYLASLPWHFAGEHLYDAGDVICIDNLEKAQETLSQCVSTVLNHGIFPIIIGGGHEVAFGSVMGDTKHLGEMPSIVNFDAHFDMRPYTNGATSGTSFRQLADICEQNGNDFHYMCVGIQKSGNTLSLFKDAATYGVSYINSEETHQYNISIPKLKSFIDSAEVIHLTICMDVFSQAIAPGVSAPQPLGINIETFMPLFHTVLNSKKVISFDIAEVSPLLDIDNRTSRLAAHIIFGVLDSISSNQNHEKEGL